MKAAWKLFLVLLLPCVPAWAQLQTDTITITAARQLSHQPDQIVFTVQVVVPETASLDDVLAALPGTGITAANLAGVSSYLNGQLAWNFTLAAPISEASATTKLLVGLVQQSKRMVSFFLQGTQVSQGLRRSQPCSQASLVADALAQAQTLAAAAGFTVGPVLAVSDGSLGPAAARLVAGELPALLTVTGFLAVGSAIPPQPMICTTVVKFQLYRYHSSTLEF
jgi:hypothetical protein